MTSRKEVGDLSTNGSTTVALPRCIYLGVIDAEVLLEVLDNVHDEHNLDARECDRMVGREYNSHH